MNTFEESKIYKSEKEIYFMLKIDENGGYIQPVSYTGEIIDSFQFYKIENEYIKKIVSLLLESKEDDFLIDWEKSSSSNIYLDDFYDLAEDLKHVENFVDENFQKIVWSFSENELTLKLEEVDYDTDML